MLHTFPRWKYFLLSIALVVGLIYSLPNLYGEDPAIQIKGLKQKSVSEPLLTKIQNELKNSQISYKSIAFEEEDSILVRFWDPEMQLNAKDRIRALVGDAYSVALNLAPVTPEWLDVLGAKPMRLGLDLRGGVRFVMEVDVPSAIHRRMEGYYADIRNQLREEKIRYSKFSLGKEETLSLTFHDDVSRNTAYLYLSNHFPELDTFKGETSGRLRIQMALTATQAAEIRNYTVDQTVTTLRNRVNELGVADAVIQRQGLNRVVVELPGIQDTARARDIIGKVATVDFVMLDEENDLEQALKGRMPPGSRILYERSGRPRLLKKRVILSGDSIVGASSAFDSRDNQPAVSVRLGGNGVALFRETTLKNQGKLMAVIYRETRTEDRLVKGQLQKEKVTTESVVSVATIITALDTSFQITGLGLEEARDLALLLRAGALPANIDFVEEHIVGPSMGQDNIYKGMVSLVVGLGSIFIFMGVYYSIFGWIANMALLFNLVLLVAVMSLIGATLTLPGIAGIVLTLGMAVDANVLIFERIREELRSGMTPHASIHRGFEQAFATIVDANLTTLIVVLILFAVGTGPVKGFAVTTSIGILTSMFTAITGTRALINCLYGTKPIKRVWVGI